MPRSSGRWAASSRRSSAATRRGRRQCSAGSIRGAWSRSFRRTSSCSAGAPVRCSSGASSRRTTATAPSCRTPGSGWPGVLRDRGVLGPLRGRFRRGAGGPALGGRYAIEINLRKGGTTHPFWMLDFLTDGTYDRATGLYRTPTGQTRVLRCDRQPPRAALRRSEPGRPRRDSRWSSSSHFHAPSEEGVVFHLIGALEPHGKLGMVCIGADRERARRLYDRTVEILDREGSGRARRGRARHRSPA